MTLDASFFTTLSKLRLSMRHKSSMNMTGNRKSIQKGSSTEFSDFREYMPGDDLRRIDWNAYARLDRLYIKEYMEEKEAMVTILLDTSASMEYGEKKKSELAEKLTAAMAYLSLNNMDRVVVYDMQRMQAPLHLSGGKKAFPKLSRWLEQCTFQGKLSIAECVRRLPANGVGMTIIISDFLQEEFLDPEQKALEKLLRYLEFRKNRPVLLQVLAGEELDVMLNGTHQLIDMEDGSTLRVTLDAGSIRIYEKALQEFIAGLKRTSASVGAFHAVCSTETDFHHLIFQDLRALYDI